MSLIIGDSRPFSASQRGLSSDCFQILPVLALVLPAIKPVRFCKKKQADENALPSILHDPQSYRDMGQLSTGWYVKFASDLCAVIGNSFIAQAKFFNDLVGG